MHAIKNASARGLKLRCSKAAFQKKRKRSAYSPRLSSMYLKKKQSSQALNVVYLVLNCTETHVRAAVVQHIFTRAFNR